MEENARRLFAVRDAKLRKNVSEMVLDRSLIDVKAGTDISVAHPLRHMGEDL
jgi:uncharacterized sporulation protein YeaH/YhbH (DUF444 family)